MRWAWRAGRTMWRLRHAPEDVKYAVKALGSVLSGYVRLEWHEPDGAWEPIGDQVPDQPYYVCAVFRNHKHLPLPLVLGGRSEYPAQNVVLATLRRLGLLRRAAADCRAYEGRWKAAA